MPDLGNTSWANPPRALSLQGSNSMGLAKLRSEEI